MKVTVWAWAQANGYNRVAAKVLRSLGYQQTLERQAAVLKKLAAAAAG